MMDKTCRKPVGMINHVLIKIDKFSFHVYSIILDIEACPKIPLILARPFMKTRRMLVEVDTCQVKVKIINHEVCFKVIGIT